MTETDGIVERPTDVIGQLEYEIDRGGNSATINAIIAARDAIVRLKLNRDFWMAASNTNLDMYNEAMARAKRAERELAAAVAKEREECAVHLELEADAMRAQRDALIEFGSFEKGGRKVPAQQRKEFAWDRRIMAEKLDIEAAAIRARSNAND